MHKQIGMHKQNARYVKRKTFMQQRRIKIKKNMAKWQKNMYVSNVIIKHKYYLILEELWKQIGGSKLIS